MKLSQMTGNTQNSMELYVQAYSIAIVLASRPLYDLKDVDILDKSVNWLNAYTVYIFNLVADYIYEDILVMNACSSLCESKCYF